MQILLQRPYSTPPPPAPHVKLHASTAVHTLKNPKHWQPHHCSDTRKHDTHCLPVLCCWIVWCMHVSCTDSDVHSCFELWSVLSRSSWIRRYIKCYVLLLLLLGMGSAALCGSCTTAGVKWPKFPARENEVLENTLTGLTLSPPSMSLTGPRLLNTWSYLAFSDGCNGKWGTQSWKRIYAFVIILVEVFLTHGSCKMIFR